MLMSKDVNCINFRGLFAFLENRYGKTGVEVVKEPNPLKIAGIGAVREDLSKSALFAGQILDLTFLSRQAAKINTRFNRSKEVRLIEVTPRMAVISSLAPDLGYIQGSPIYMGKVVMNLVGNAAEALLQSGEIRIGTENCMVEKVVNGYEAIQTGDCVKLIVADSGIGISTGDLQHIFEPFYMKKAMGRSGTGLGMSVVWRKVKDYNGFIDVSSEEGKGTVFTLYFPVTEKRPVEVEKGPSLDNMRGNGESILAVDDNKNQRIIEIAKHNQTLLA